MLDRNPKNNPYIPSSSIILNDPDSVWIDEDGVTPGYFCLQKPVRVDRDLIDELKRISLDRGRQNMRLCLHENADATFHDMIILEYQSVYNRPHKHASKGETYHMIEGTQGLFIFDQNGTVTDACKLEPAGNFMFRVDNDMYHMVMPVSELVIYHEARLGPFKREIDSIFADWAPDGADPNAAADYVETTRSRLEVS